MARLTPRLHQFILLALVKVPLARHLPWSPVSVGRAGLGPVTVFVALAAARALAVLVLQFWRRRAAISRLVAPIR